jgi:hypothetical protein
MKLAPIVLFVYNRPAHTRRTVEALQKNELAGESDLFIFSDAPKKQEAAAAVSKVREYIKSISGFKSVSIVERDRNFGLANSIIDGVTRVCNEYGRVIVLEDDLVTSPYFLRYMNDALAYYEFEDKVACVNSYVFPVKGELPETFFLRGGGNLGWATWQRSWSLFEADEKKLLDGLTRLNILHQFDFNGAFSYSEMLKQQIAGMINSWAIRWHASAYLLDKLTLHPTEPLIVHIGNDGSGTHYGNRNGVDDFMGERISNRPIEVGGIAVEHNVRAAKLYEQHFRHFKRSRLRTLLGMLKSRIKRLFL